MRLPRLALVLVVGLALPGGVLRAQEAAPAEPAGEAAGRVQRELMASDPLAASSTSELLAANNETRGEIARLIREGALEGAALDRTLRLSVALNRCDRVSENAAQPTHPVVWWLALDELDRELPHGPREALLRRALPDETQRARALDELAAGRAVAERFCHDWNETWADDATKERYDGLERELTKAGSAALPYIATLLAIPPQAVFTTIDDARGPTARSQVRALWAVRLLEARTLTPHVAFHVRGPSFTECATARGTLRALAGLTFPDGGDEDAELAVVDAWWKPGWVASWERDHLVRHVLRWAREGLASDDPERQYRAGFGPMQLARIVGELAWENDAPLDVRRARVLEIEHEAMLRQPACIR